MGVCVCVVATNHFAKQTYNLSLCCSYNHNSPFSAIFSYSDDDDDNNNIANGNDDNDDDDHQMLKTVDAHAMFF